MWSKLLSKLSFRSHHTVNWSWRGSIGPIELRGRRAQHEPAGDDRQGSAIRDGREERRMNIDMGALHAIVLERGISFDDLLEDVKAAVLSAYRHTEGHQPDAHIDIDRK